MDYIRLYSRLSPFSGRDSLLLSAKLLIKMPKSRKEIL